VLVRKAFKFRIYPTTEQAARLDRWSDALRFLWNLANEQRLIGYSRPRDCRVYPTAFNQANELTVLRAELPWLADVPRNVSMQLLHELDKAWQRCFNRLARQPKWKKKGRDVLGLCEPHPKVWHLDGDKLHFPKIGPICTVVHRPLEGKPKTCTIKRDGDQWFVSIVCEIEVADPVPKIDPVVAIDRGVINVIADSDGRIVEAPRYLKALLRRLARAQRRVSRRKKGSRNRAKAKRRVARIHRKVRRQREHFLHVLSHGYAKSHGTVVIEKLQIGNMVKVNRGLSRGILDAGWSILGGMLRYKLAWAGGQLVEVPAAYSSQTCSACGHVDPKSRVSQALFLCTACGYSDHADLNAAKVLKRRANRSVLPVEDSLMSGTLRSRKRLRVPKRASESSSL
jgi:putative transposase